MANTKKQNFGTRVNGAHYVQPRGELRPNQCTQPTGKLYHSLTAARRASQRGDAIVRADDGRVVSVK